MLVKSTDKWVEMMVPVLALRLFVAPVDQPKSKLKDSKIHLDDIEEDDTAQALCYDVKWGDNRFGVLVLLPREYNESLLWHESIHAANFFLDATGIPSNSKEDEALCYLTEWIVKMIKKHYYGMDVEFLEH